MTLSKRKCSKCGYEDPEPLKEVIKCPYCGGDWVGVLVAQMTPKWEWRIPNGKIDLKNIQINGLKELQLRDSIKRRKK